MSPSELRRAIAQLTGGASGPELYQLADQIRDELRQPWVDRTLADRGNEALESRRLRTIADWVPAPLRPGETWLLLCETGRPTENDRGVAVRVRYSQTAVECLFSENARRHIDFALQGLHAAIARVGRALDRPPQVDGYEVLGVASDTTIEDGSLGLSICVAGASHALEAPPRDGVAGSACVRTDGRLARVAYLREKLGALKRSWPNVNRLVVAAEQDDIGEEAWEGLRIVRCATLREALAEFGLDIASLRLSCSLEDHEAACAAFKAENMKPHSAREWRELSWRAWQASCALEGQPETFDLSVRAKAYAALFAVHGGEPTRAADVVRQLRGNEEALEVGIPGVMLWLAVLQAITEIDNDHPDAAVKLMREALHSADRDGSTPADIVGQAMGTYGRALMHAGQLAEAEAELANAVGFYERAPSQALRREAARSRTYLAKSMRMRGRPTEALAVLGEALRLIGQHGSSSVASTTSQFVALERGRSLLALGRAAEALGAFRLCVEQQRNDDAYPRLAGVRGLAAAYRVLGERAEADKALDRCLGIARRYGREIMGRVAAAAAGDALLSEQPSRVGKEELELIWSRSFGGSTEKEEVRRALSHWVY